MKIVLSLIFTLLFALSIGAQTGTTQITGGKFIIKGNWGEEARNATIQGADFAATSYLGGIFSPWYDICNSTPDRCAFGKTITAPQYGQVYIGGCVGSCYQFVSGTFVLGDVAYPNAYFRGEFNFSRESFFIPRVSKRKGFVRLRKPFTLTGRLQVCSETNIDRLCPPQSIVFDKNVEGHGTLTFTGEIKIFEAGTTSYPYLLQRSFEYQFEP